jgi:hypothetical protein
MGQSEVDVVVVWVLAHEASIVTTTESAEIRIIDFFIARIIAPRKYRQIRTLPDPSAVS